MIKATRAQNYPRIQDETSHFTGFLDDSRLQPHIYEITGQELEKIIVSAINYAHRKSSRAILNIPDGTSKKIVGETYIKEGKRLFEYFKKYCGDPASTAYDCLGKHFSVIAKEQFRNRTLQKERMNSGWRYQSIAKDGALHSKRFISISDIGANEADFNATISVLNHETDRLTIYVSVKNRVNTMGGQDWPKAIHALEEVAKVDKNRDAPYLCVFGIAMEKGLRIIKNEQLTKRPYSNNTEIWQSDFFWPFFTNLSYEEVITAVLRVLINAGRSNSSGIEIPKKLVDSFGKCCETAGLLDKNGCFNDAFKLANLFVRSTQKKSK